MNNTIQFYHSPVSRGRIVHWLLEELEVPYEIHWVKLKAGDQKKPDFLALNPMGKIPAVVVNGSVITETAAICCYLADWFPDKGLAPKLTDPDRATYLRWFFFGNGCLEPAIVDKLSNRGAPEKIEMNGYGTFHSTIKTIETALTPGPYILGNQFSAVDIYLSSTLLWGMAAKVIEPTPIFRDYVSRTKDRAAYKRFDDQCKAQSSL